jgi:hypothetical protein
MLPPDAVFSGLTAAWLHGLDVDPLHPVEVTVPTCSGVRSRMNLAVRHCHLASSDVATKRELRVTVPSRTFAELKRRLSRTEFLVLADAAIRLRLGHFDELAEPAESPMETRLRWLLLDAGLPRPHVQVDLRDHDGRFVGRADLCYPEHRLAIEYDGANHRERLVDDNRRQNLMLAAGYQLLRFTAADLMQSPDRVVAQVRRATMTSR